MWITKGRKLAGLVAATVITALVVAACGGSDDPAPSPTRAPVIVVPTATPAPTQAPQIVVQTAAPQATAAPASTQAPQIVVQTAAPQEAATAAPTPTPRLVVQVPTSTPVPGLAGITEVLKGFRWLQGPGLESWRQAPKRGGTHTYAFPSPSSGTDQILNRSYTVSTAISFVYSKLFTCQFSPLMVEADPGSCFPVGDLISEWESNADATSWTITIHPDAVWHDMPSDSRGYTTELSGLYGRPVVADDVVHTLNYWQGNLTKPNGEPQSTPSAQAHSQTVVSADVIDDKTLRFNLVTTDPFFIATFSQFNARVVPPEIFNMDGDYTHRTVGSGAFRLDDYDRQIGWGGNANPDYFKTGADGEALPYVDRHQVKVIGGDLTRSGFITGQIDNGLSVGVSGPSSAITFGRSCPQCQVIEYFLSSNTSRILGFKHLPTESFPDPYFGDRNARLAIAKSIDYESLGENIYEGAWIMTPVAMPWGLGWDTPPTLRQMGLDLPDDENPFIYDPDQAKELWAMAGKKAGEKITLYYHQYSAPDTTYHVALGASIAESLDIEVEVLKVPDISILYSMSGFVNPEDIQNHEFLISHTRALGAHNAFVPLANRSFAPQNYMGFNNPRMDELATEWALAPEFEREKEIATEYYAETVKELIYMPAITQASYDVQGARVRNSYQQLAGGRAFHQGGQLAEIIWLDE